MAALASAYLFLLGLASGLTLLTISSYRRVSPRWVKWLLISSGLFVFSRYITMALFTNIDGPAWIWRLRYCWFATTVGLTLPSAFAIDQLLRHPAMTPKKLLGYLTPFLLTYVAVIIGSHPTPEADRIVGWTLRLTGGWRLLLSIAQGIFVVGFIGICLSLIRRLLVRRIRLALAGLVLAHAYLGIDGIILVSGGWYFRPYLFSEMLTLLALWYAFETAAALQQTS